MESTRTTRTEATRASCMYANILTADWFFTLKVLIEIVEINKLEMMEIYVEFEATQRERMKIDWEKRTIRAENINERVALNLESTKETVKNGKCQYWHTRVFL